MLFHLLFILHAKELLTSFTKYTKCVKSVLFNVCSYSSLSDCFKIEPRSGMLYLRISTIMLGLIFATDRTSKQLLVIFIL